MLEDFFVVPIMDLDANWMMRGFTVEEYAREYCEEVLDIPSEYIDVATLSEEGLELALFDVEEIVEEDWYIQLKRVSKYVCAS